MKFELDQQTLSDLEIFGDKKSKHTIFQLYNRTQTNGGQQFLLELMENPITDIQLLKKRVELIKYNTENEFELEINTFNFRFIEYYLQLNTAPLHDNLIDAYYQFLSYKFKPTNEYYLLKTGIEKLKELFLDLKEKLPNLLEDDAPTSLKQLLLTIQGFMEKEDFAIIFIKKEKLTCTKLNKLDYLFRKKHKIEFNDFIRAIYALDAYISIGKTVKNNNFSFPNYIDTHVPNVSITQLFHPLLAEPVPYNFEINESNNLCFLTGPNMAGKSTFLKSLGIAVYLSHLGFPVPASQMTTSVFNGIISTINLSDNINKGYSHFYSEVNRVKETAVKLKEKKKLFVIFDELFRGTNVKDAFDASLLIINSFTKIKNSTFCISTHITEVADSLENNNKVNFKYFDSNIIDNIPVYNFQLKDGVSLERLGMYIVKNEKIIEILNSITEE